MICCYDLPDLALTASSRRAVISPLTEVKQPQSPVVLTGVRDPEPKWRRPRLRIATVSAFDLRVVVEVWVKPDPILAPQRCSLLRQPGGT
jgi:hypothetical protein